jgi:hypothetical protein
MCRWQITTCRGDSATANNLIDIIDKMLSLDSSGTEFPTFSATDLMRVPHIVEEQEGVATIQQLLASLSEMKKFHGILPKINGVP